MQQRHQQLANRVVERFKGILGADARERISDAQYEELGMMVRAALSAQLEEVAARVTAFGNELRAGVEQKDIGL